ncbi:histidinol-phosphatase HisJ family protein [Fusobacterium perfoetens]|uniref:histidinol-phosphatase HisJ family protein n=1 Tax=Fusobacterium perfoetens TaxID=852 RepID=UPI001F29230B|nr:histidinol-phosphatase HisJ family protein [Fusobacterium perfoetens]MCF2625802.1 histidinol-phosphatase HisJ family protein [Fusobacterium perfoetens]
MYKGDSHVHSRFSADSKEKLENIFEKAVELGLDEITITDHMDFADREEDDLFVFDIDEYVKTLNTYKQKYKDKLIIKIGVEVGIQPHLYKRYEPVLKANCWDFIIGSSHSVDHMDVGYNDIYLKYKTKNEVHRRYFETILENLDIYHDISVYGHLDFIRRYGGGVHSDHKIIDLELHKELIDKILKKLISKNIGIEINTSGIRYGVGDFHPCREILARYKELGGKIITIGSDAHRAEDIAKDFGEAKELLKSLGYKYFCTFTNRKLEFKEL